MGSSISGSGGEHGCGRQVGEGLERDRRGEGPITLLVGLEGIRGEETARGFKKRQGGSATEPEQVLEKSIRADSKDF